MSTLDFQVGVDQWVDVYQTTGITKGVPLIIQNKGSGYLSVFISDIAPQAQGGHSDLGQERIFRSNSVYHLRIASLDTQPQNISAYISWFEGDPDLPLPDGF